MKANRNAGSLGRRERREFSAEFKAEAVRLVAERRASGATLAQVGRELDVRPDQLRAWAKQLGHDPKERSRASSPNRKCVGCGARSPCCGRSRPSQKGSGGVLRERVALRYAVIARHRDEFEVRLMCRVLEVTPSGSMRTSSGRGRGARSSMSC
jgi:putative transposase